MRYEELDVFHTGYEALVSFFRTIDSRLQILSDGFISYAKGVTAWYEAEISHDALCKSFTVFKEGQLDERSK